MATATRTTRTTGTAPARRTEALRLPRTTGAVSGLVIVVLGVWGGLIPFIGPYFHYAFGGFQSWHFTSQRLWLDILPGAVAVIGGLMLMSASTRSGGLIASWVAMAAGAWFAVGPAVSMLWHHTIYAIGTPMGGDFRQMLEWVGYFTGLGVLIVGFAAFAMGRYFSRPRVAEEPVAMAADAAALEADRPRRRFGMFGRRRQAVAVADRPVADRPVADRAVADEPVADRPVADEPAADSSVGERPVAD